jgi:hypothetical protein
MAADGWTKPTCMSASAALRPWNRSYVLVYELVVTPGGPAPDRGTCPDANGESQRCPTRDVERKMGTDVDTDHAHEGDGGQGERAAARAQTGQGGRAERDGHACMPGQVAEPAGVAATASDARK